MANDRNDRKKHRKSRGGGKEQRPGLSPEQKLERKIENAKKDDFTVIQRRTLDTNSFLGLVAKHDYLVDRLRKRIEIDSTIDPVKAIELLRKGRELREALNQLNVEICGVMDFTYKPPRDFEQTVEELKKAAASSESGETDGKAAVVKELPPPEKKVAPKESAIGVAATA